MVKSILILLAVCVGTGIVEEIVFRAGGIWLFCKLLKDDFQALIKAVLLTSFIFAILHVSGIETALMADGAHIGLLLIQVILKFTQAFMFGVCMGALYLKTKTILWPIVVHIIFDVVYFAPAVLSSGQFPQTYFTGNLFDIGILALTVALFLLPCAKSLKWLRREVVPYTAPYSK